MRERFDWKVTRLEPRQMLAVDVNLGENPISLTGGDFNHDGYQDLATANPDSNNVSVLLGNGDGSFGLEASFGVGDKPQSITVGHFNDDNHLDLATANFSDGTVSLLLGRGTGSFEAMAISVADGPTAVTTADFNGDRIPDLATAHDSGELSVLWGEKEGNSIRFELEVLSPRGVAGAVAMGVGDFNNDDRPDLVTAYRSTTNIQVLLSCDTCAKGFEETMPVRLFAGVDEPTTDMRPDSLAVGDFDKDGFSDLAVAIGNLQTVLVLMNNRDGSFKELEPLVLDDRSLPRSIAIADIDVDERLDLVTANVGSDSVSLLRQTADGFFQPIEKNGSPVRPRVGNAPFAVITGQFNDDNHLDIATVNRDSNDVSVLLGHGVGVFLGDLTEPGRLPTGEAPVSVVLDFFDDDGFLDLATAHADSNDVRVLRGQGNGTFSDDTFTLGFTDSEHVVRVHDLLVSAGDFNGDGELDLITRRLTKSDIVTRANIAVLPGPLPWGSTLTIEDGEQTVLKQTLLSGLLVDSFATGHLVNEDDFLDLVAVDFHSGLLVLKGMGDGTFEEIDRIPLQRPTFITTADFGAEGGVGLVTSHSGSDEPHVTVLLRKNGSFKIAGEFTVGPGTTSVATEDFNGDGHVDLVASSADGVTVLLLEMEGDEIRLSNEVDRARFEVELDGKPSAVVVGQFNDDNGDEVIDDRDFPDLATANRDSHNVSILLASGDGQFQEVVRLPTGREPSVLAVGDFDGDVLLDLVAANRASNDLSLFRGVASLLETDPGEVRRSIFSSGVVSVTAGDFDGDDRLDLATANSVSGDVSIVLSIGDAFGEQTRFEAGDEPRHIITARLNSDMALDLVTADYQAHRVSVVLGLGDGSFGERVQFDVGDGPRSVTVADIDADGTLDLITANELSDSVTVLLLSEADSRVSVSSQRDYHVGDDADPVSVTTGDLDGDGDLDLAVANFASADVSILFQQNDGSFLAELGEDGEPKRPHVGKGPSSIMAIDLDGDGDLDLMTANSASADVSILVQQDDGSFVEDVGENGEPIRPQVGTGPSSIMAIDLNGDGRPDLATANRISNDVSVLVGMNSDEPGWSFQPVRIAVPDGPVQLTLADLDNDSIVDIVTANQDSDDLSVLIGLNHGIFKPPTRVNVGSGPSSVVIGKFNDDDLLDVAATNEFGDIVSIQLGAGDGSFDRRTDLSVGDGPASVILGQFDDDNGDGLIDDRDSMDLATANSESNTVSILIRTEESSEFIALDPVGVGLFPVSITAGLFNDDNRLDVATANSVSNTVSVLFGGNNGTFSFSRHYRVGSGPSSVTTADFDGDGDADLVTVNEESDDLSILLGNGDGTFSELTVAGVPVRPKVGKSPSSLTAKDLNGDEQTDLVVTNFGGNSVSILIGRGDGTFHPQIEFPTGDQPSGVITAHFSDDNRDRFFDDRDLLDLATANLGSNDVSVFLGQPNGTFKEFSRGGQPVRLAVGNRPRALAAGDFDRDGDLEIVAASQTPGDLPIFQVSISVVGSVFVPLTSVSTFVAQVTDTSGPVLADGSVFVAPDEIVSSGSAGTAAGGAVSTDATEGLEVADELIDDALPATPPLPPSPPIPDEKAPKDPIEPLDFDSRLPEVMQAESGGQSEPASEQFRSSSGLTTGAFEQTRPDLPTEPSVADSVLARRMSLALGIIGAPLLWKIGRRLFPWKRRNASYDAVDTAR